MAHLLKDTLVNQQNVESFINDVERDRKTLNECIATMRKNELDVNTVDDLMTITAKGYLRKFIDDAKAAYFGGLNTFTPREIKADISAKFEKIFNANIDAVTTAAKIIANNPYTMNVTSDGRFFFSEKEIKDAAVKKSTRTFTPEEKEYYRLMGNVIDSMAEMTRWEEVHKWTPFSKQGVSLPVMGGGLVFTNLFTIYQQGFTPDYYAALLSKGFFGYDWRRNINEVNDDD